MLFMTQGASESSGIQQSGDLLHPVALFSFTAVTRTENPPSEQSESIKFHRT